MSHGDRQLEIRRIHDDEGRVLRALRLRSLTDAPHAFGQRLEEAVLVPDAEWGRYARSAADGDRRAWFFAVRDNQHVGLVQGRRRPPRTLLVFSLWVDPTVRGHGVGRRLVDGLEAWARDWGAAETVLWVHTANAAAQGFYRKLGFEVQRDGDDAESGRRFGAVALLRSTASSLPGRRREE